MLKNANNVKWVKKGMIFRVNKFSPAHESLSILFRNTFS